MRRPAAKQGGTITAIDTHIAMAPSPGGPVPTPLPHPFNGIINGNLISNVTICSRQAATVGSTADNIPPHIPTPPGTSFQKPPANQARIQLGSGTVRINGKQAVRNGDITMTCNDPVDLPAGTVIALGTVMIGG